MAVCQASELKASRATHEVSLLKSAWQALLAQMWVMQMVGSLAVHVQSACATVETKRTIEAAQTHVGRSRQARNEALGVCTNTS